jgi:hypothetical protein
LARFLRKGVVLPEACTSKGRDNARCSRQVDLVAAIIDKGAVSHSRSVVTALRNRLGVLPYLLHERSWRKLPKCDVLLAVHDNNRGASLGGRAYSSVMDSLAQRLQDAGLECETLALPYSRLIGKKAFGSPVSINRLYFLYDLVRIPWNLLGLGNRWTEEKVYSWVLTRAGCAVVIMTNPDPSLCRAAHANGVTVVNVFHGVGYAGPTRTLGVDEGLPRNEKPDLFLSLDHITTQSLKKGMEVDQEVMEIDHPWFSRFDGTLGTTAVETEWELPDDVLAELGRFRKVVLLSLQWGYDGTLPLFTGIVSNGVIHESVLDAVGATRGEVLWIVRLHPVQLRSPKYRKHRQFVHQLEAASSNVLSTSVSMLPLPVLLAQCDGHITMSSMCCYEAAWMRVPSLALCPTLQRDGPFADYFADLQSAGLLVKGTLVTDEIVAWSRCAEKKPEPLSRTRGQTDVAVGQIVEMCEEYRR